MLSICVPIYNFDMRELVKTLSAQIATLNVDCELILIDDRSSEKYRLLNAATCRRHTYIELPENIGRSRIRNLFLNYARYDYLLFLDCDVKIISDNFLSTYVEFIRSTPQAKVICGGRIYPKTWNNKHAQLRWHYGIKRETFDIETRKDNPWKSFLSNNFVVYRKILQQFPFEEKLSEYGHEDTLFGHTMMKNNIYIHYIENPILNNDIEENDCFLKKTSEGMKNLVKIVEFTNFDADFIKISKILYTYFQLKKHHCLPLVRVASFFTQKPIDYLLRHAYTANLFLFDLWKLFALDKEFRKAKL